MVSLQSLSAYARANIAAIHYCVRILIGSSLLWLLLHNEQTTNSLWAIISLITVTEPQVRPAWDAVFHFVINTLIGCAVSLLCLTTIGIHVWLLPPVITLCALISALVNKLQQGWKSAPTTSAIILSAAMTQKSANAALLVATHRTLEVLIGSVVALIVTRVVAWVWLPREVKQSATKTAPV